MQLNILFFGGFDTDQTWSVNVGITNAAHTTITWRADLAHQRQNIPTYNRLFFVSKILLSSIWTKQKVMKIIYPFGMSLPYTAETYTVTLTTIRSDTIDKKKLTIYDETKIGRQECTSITNPKL